MTSVRRANRYLHEIPNITNLENDPICDISPLICYPRSDDRDERMTMLSGCCPPMDNRSRVSSCSIHTYKPSTLNQYFFRIGALNFRLALSSGSSPSSPGANACSRLTRLLGPVSTARTWDPQGYELTSPVDKVCSHSTPNRSSPEPRTCASQSVLVSLPCPFPSTP